MPDGDYLAPLQPAKAGSPAEPLTLPANDAAVHGLSRFRIGAPVPDFDAVRQHRAAQRAGLRRRTSGAWGLTATVPRILRETSRTKLLCPEGSAPPFSPRNLRPRHMIAPARPRRRDTAGTQNPKMLSNSLKTRRTRRDSNSRPLPSESRGLSQASKRRPRTAISRLALGILEATVGRPRP